MDCDLQKYSARLPALAPVLKINKTAKIGLLQKFDSRTHGHVFHYR